MNAIHKRAYHLCMNCFNGFRRVSVKDKHYEYCSSNGHLKVKMPSENEKWLKFHSGQYQLKDAFMLCETNKHENKQYSEKMN